MTIMKKVNKYKQLKSRIQKEIDEFPIYFAFGNEQFEELLRKLGLSENEDSENFYAKKLVRVGSFGVVLREDAPRLTKMMEDHTQQIREQIAKDKTGNGFIKDMFEYELRNHEYGYTGDSTDAVEALGLTFEEIENDERLSNGFRKAKRRIEREENAKWAI